jgi:hypothetical protein
LPFAEANNDREGMRAGQRKPLNDPLCEIGLNPMNTIIKRCPSNPEVGILTEQVARVMRQRLGIAPRIINGRAGEFSVYVDGVPVIMCDSQSLPWPEEVEAAVQSLSAV